MKPFFLLLFLATLCPFSHAQTRRFINPPGQQPSGYSHAVEVSGGRTIYVAGQVAMSASGAVVGANDFRAQAKQVFENLKTVLAASGATLDDVVKFTYYVVGHDAEKLRLIREVRDEYLKPTNRPASTLVGVQALFRPEFLLEVEAVAVVNR